MLQGYLYDGLRSPFGRHAGALAGIRPDDLAAQVLVARSQLPAERIEDVIMGNVRQSGEDSRNVARFVGLLAGVREAADGLTVNRLCVGHGGRAGCCAFDHRGRGRRHRKHDPRALCGCQIARRLGPPAGGLRFDHRHALPEQGIF